MRRREFITLVGSSAVWPLVARAQQPETMRRIGELMNMASDDREGQAGLAAFSQALQKLGRTAGRQVQIDTRWGENNEDLDRRYAAELIALRPDVFLASGSLSVAAFKRITGNMPIVFVGVSDPECGGIVESL